MADLGPDEEMIEAVAAFHDRGVRTGLISNSWGTALKYEEDLMARAVRRPGHLPPRGDPQARPGIYALGAERNGLAPEACVFVDDLPGNLKPARAMGMATVVHAAPPRPCRSSRSCSA